jgi:large subunit ribosomal protein LP1
MASTATVSKAEHDELCCGYAALILQDDGLDVTSDNITKLITASGNEVESYWPGLFAKAVSALNLKDLLSNVGTGGGAAAPAAGGAAAAEAVAEEEKAPEEEEADVDMGDIFGGDDEY